MCFTDKDIGRSKMLLLYTLMNGAERGWNIGRDSLAVPIRIARTAGARCPRINIRMV